MSAIVGVVYILSEGHDFLQVNVFGLDIKSNMDLPFDGF